MTRKVRRDSGENEIIAVKKKCSRKPKVSSEDFVVPRYEEYGWLDEYNYTLSQLRAIARHYKLPVSGNKDKLTERIDEHLRRSVYSTRIQRVFRGCLQRRYNKTHGPAFRNRSLCNNATDFYSMDNIDDIPLAQFFSYEDEDGFIYGFDLLSLYNLILTGGRNAQNPYNRRPLPGTITGAIRHKIRLSHVLGIAVDTVIDTSSFISAQKRHELRVLSLFQEIDSLGNYTDASWFAVLDKRQMVKYLSELVDIWTYRAQLPVETKLQICPPNGDPFRNTNVNMASNLSAESLQRFVLSAMECLVKNGVDRDSRALGAYYVLAALTLVSLEAAEAMPWLYHSVVHI
jgi:hypothetical protein